MAYEERALPQIQAAQDEMEAIEAEISALRDPLERTVLRLRYIDGEYCRYMKWKDVATNVYGDNEEKYLTAVHRIHERALQNLRAAGTNEKSHP